jgi:signal transduction histidine kinase/ligand-binding sensor domain-containing protein
VRKFSFYAQKDGPSNYNVHKIIQDNKNFLWIATQDGLNRFDGNLFTEYNKNQLSKRTLLSNDIHELIYDTAQNIVWVICNQGGINGIDIITGNVIYSILYSNKSLEAEWRICAVMFKENIFIGTSGGLEIFNTRKHAFENSILSKKNFPYGFHLSDIRTITIDSNKNLWIAIKDKGILIYDPEKDSVLQTLSLTLLLKNGQQNFFWPVCAVFSIANIYWAGTENGMIALQYENNYNIRTYPLSKTSVKIFTPQKITDLETDNNGDLLICSNSLYRYSIFQNKLFKIQPADMESAKWTANITSCYEDLQHNLWIGYRQGLAQMKNSKPAFIPTRNNKDFGDVLGHVYGICALDSERILTGTEDGLYLINTASRTSLKITGGFVQNIFRFLNNDVVISGNKGVRLWHKNHIVSIADEYQEFKSYQHMQFNSRVILNDSVMIIGTESNDGILIWNFKEHSIQNIRQSNDNKGLLSNIVNTVYVDNKNRIMVLSDYGITLINSKNFLTKKIKWENPLTGMPLGIFMDITETSNYYWVNTYSEGLLMLDTSFKIIKKFASDQSISNTGLYKIFNYKDSLLILTSNYGISIFNTETKSFTKYYEEDGLQNNTFEEACGDIVKDAFYAGGVNGFVKVTPSLLSTSIKTPQLYFTGIKIQRSKNRITDSSSLNLKQINVPNDVLQTTISFTGLYYDNPQKVQYAYRLKENESNWIYLGGQNYIMLIGLTPGKHILQLKACNENNIWCDVKELDLNYLPKWYQTIAFKILLGILIISIIYIFYQYRVSQIKRQQAKLHEVREEIANDLHDDIGSTLNGIKIFTHLAEHAEDKQKYFSQITDSLKYVSEGLRDMIWVLDDNNDTAGGLMHRLKVFMQPVAEASNIHISFIIEGQSEKQLNKKEKRNLLMIAKEAINNSIKYAGCENIDVVFEISQESHALVIRDNGKGFEENTITPGNGLKNMRTRAGQIGYSVRLITSYGKGTTIKVIYFP